MSNDYNILLSGGAVVGLVLLMFSGWFMFFLCLIAVALFLIRDFMQGPRCTSPGRLDGKIVVITGGNTGIGKETAKALSKRGARIVLACRDTKKAEAAASEIRTETGGTVDVEELNLASFASVRKCADQLNKLPQINILINNAGVMMTPRWETEDGNEMQFQTNHLGHFLLTNLLLQKLKDSAPARIVNVSSLAHERGSMKFDDLNGKKSYGRVSAYNQSKLANVLFTKELAKRLTGTGVTTYSLHPGVINTELTRHISNALPSFIAPLINVFNVFIKTADAGAQTTIYCAVDQGIANKSGLYYSDCAEKTPAKAALDEDAQRRLWSVSEEMVGLSGSSRRDVIERAKGIVESITERAKEIVEETKEEAMEEVQSEVVEEVRQEQVNAEVEAVQKIVEEVKEFVEEAKEVVEEVMQEVKESVKSSPPQQEVKEESSSDEEEVSKPVAAEPPFPEPELISCTSAVVNESAPEPETKPEESSSSSSSSEDEEESAKERRPSAEILAGIEEFDKHNLKHTETKEDVHIPKIEEIEREREIIESETAANKSLYEGVTEEVKSFEASNLKEVETKESYALPDKYDLMAERTHEGLLKEVEEFQPQEKLSHVKTVEPVSPMAFAAQETIVSDIERFNRDSLKPTETIEDSHIPTKEEIAEEAEVIKKETEESQKMFSEVLSEVSEFHTESLKHVETKDDSILLPDKIELVTEKSHSEVLQELQSFQTETLKHTETHEPLSAEEVARAEYHRSETVESVATFDRSSLKSTHTEEKVVLPDADTLAMEKQQHQLLESIEQYEASSLRKVETKESTSAVEIAKQEIVHSQLVESLSSFEKESLRQTETVEKVLLPTEEDISGERSHKQLLAGIESFDPSKLKESDTREAMSGVEMAKREMAVHQVIESVESFDRTAMKSTHTEEKSVLPAAEDIEAERAHRSLIEGIESFEAASQLKHVEVKEAADPQTILKEELTRKEVMEEIKRRGSQSSSSSEGPDPDSDGAAKPERKSSSDEWIKVEQEGGQESNC